MGRRARGGAQPRTCGGVSSSVNSDISTNSNSRIFFTTFRGRDAAGFKGPGVDMSTVAVGSNGLPVDVEADAAAASRSRPEDLPDPGEKRGRSLVGSPPVVKKTQVWVTVILRVLRYRGRGQGLGEESGRHMAQPVRFSLRRVGSPAR